MRRVVSLEKTLMLGGIGAGGEGDDRGWDGWMASPTLRMWVWVNSGSWWWTGRPGVLRFMGSQRVGHDWATELNWEFLGNKLDNAYKTLSTGLGTCLKFWTQSESQLLKGWKLICGLRRRMGINHLWMLITKLPWIEHLLYTRHYAMSFFFFCHEFCMYFLFESL